ncbi:alpha/beta fold hydrolase [Nonomuraea sp. NPDC049784]|uniref:alpha/beta fold hydrolase n=1 Tax=Nonomuraea sp. NPDC049784 TaxID=3154361 RepID=UPI0033E374B3
MWHRVAPQLAEHFTVIATDLRGFGASGTPPSTPDHAPYSMRAIARDQVEVMRALGYEEFAVAGHDRGARCAYRMAPRPSRGHHPAGRARHRAHRGSLWPRGHGRRARLLGVDLPGGAGAGARAADCGSALRPRGPHARLRVAGAGCLPTRGGDRLGGLRRVLVGLA